MKIARAVLTAAAPNQRALPLQSLVDRDGEPKSVLALTVEEALRAGVEEIGVVVFPGDEAAYRAAAGRHAPRLTFIPQPAPLGYGHAVWCARDFARGEPFLHMIGDHVFVASGERGTAAQICETAAEQECAVSGVQATRENLLPYFGTVGGRRAPGSARLYEIERVVEKPTPTQAEQELLVPGLRAGHYLCFFGIHALTPRVLELLDRRVAERQDPDRVDLSPVLDELAASERYLAFEAEGRRYPIDARYGLLTAQLALALSGPDRDEVLTNLLELLALRDRDRGA